MTDLYKLIGCRRNSSNQLIRAKIRKLKMEYHPDRGGNPDTFKLICQAEDVLLDPERRARYDETGEYDQGVPVNEFNHCQPIVTEALFRAVQSVGEAQQSHLATDMAQATRIVLGTMEDEIEAQLKEMEKGRLVLEEIRKRFHSDKPINAYRCVIDHELKGGAKIEQALRQKLDLVRRTILLLKDDVYQFDQAVVRNTFVGSRFVATVEFARCGT